MQGGLMREFDTLDNKVRRIREDIEAHLTENARIFYRLSSLEASLQEADRNFKRLLANIRRCSNPGCQQAFHRETGEVFVLPGDDYQIYSALPKEPPPLLPLGWKLSDPGQHTSFGHLWCPQHGSDVG